MGPRLLAGIGLCVVSSAVAGEGWRGDGTGQVPDVSAPAPWTPAWQVPMDARSNATPVVFGDVVCTMVEPDRVWCGKTADGTKAWSVAHPVMAALSGAEKVEAQAALASVDGMEAEHDALLRARSSLKREARRRDAAADVKEALAQVEERITTTRQQLDATAWLRTPERDEMMGYTTPTPVVHDGRLYTLVSNGVVACHEADGSVRWRRYLGERSDEGMRGYHAGHAASPVVVGGTLVVGWAHLMGLDPATGAVRWTDDAPWKDFGTPATLDVGAVPLVFTPQGRALRATDGATLLEDLGDVYYVGPYAVGDAVYYVGGPPSDATARKGSIPQKAWTLTAAGDGVTAMPRWATSWTLSEVFYTAPVLRDDALYSVDKSGLLRIVDAESGAVRHSVDLLPDLGGWTYPSPVATTDGVWLGSGKGRFVAVDGSGAVVHRVDLGAQTRATPAFVEGAVYVRTLEGLGKWVPGG